MHAAPSRAATALPAGPVLAGLCVLAFANGSLARIVLVVREHGLAGALVGTFGISAVTWLGFAAAVDLARRAGNEPLSRADAVVAAVVLLLVLLPAGPLSWIGLTGLALHLLRRADRRPLGWVLLALAGNMAWGRWLLVVAGAPVLAADAWMVGRLTGAVQAGNTVGTDDAPFIFVAPACSSVANLSLAVLAVTLGAEYLRLYRGAEVALRLGLAGAAVVLLNVGRIAAMMSFPDWFDWLHEGPGEALAAWLTLFAVLACCWSRGERHPS